jgi:phosphodiesterase/alkaline phosphatase D-like protein
MPPPILRDVALEQARSGSVTGLQEAWVSCYTGRAAEACTVLADYGPTTAYGFTSPVQAAATYHRVPLGDLTPGATYHFRLRANNGQETVSQDYAFANTPGRVPPGPTVTPGAPTGITATGATVPWTTAPACPNGQVNYGTTVDELLRAPRVTSESGSGTRTAHTVALAGLTASTRYYYRVFQVAPDGNSTLSAIRSFVTTA